MSSTVQLSNMRSFRRIFHNSLQHLLLFHLNFMVLNFELRNGFRLISENTIFKILQRKPICAVRLRTRGGEEKYEPVKIFFLKKLSLVLARVSGWLWRILDLLSKHYLCILYSCEQKLVHILWYVSPVTAIDISLSFWKEKGSIILWDAILIGEDTICKPQRKKLRSEITMIVDGKLRSRKWFALQKLSMILARILWLIMTFLVLQGSAYS